MYPLEVSRLLDNAQQLTPISYPILPAGFNARIYNAEFELSKSSFFLKFENNIFIDIETIPSEHPPSIEEIKVPGNIKKPESIQKYVSDPKNIEDQYRKESLISYKGRVLCIGIAINDNDPVIITGEKEEEIFRKLDDSLSSLPRVSWIGFNSRKFDMVWIWQRALKYACSNIIESINPNKYEGNIIDIMELMSGGLDYQYRISLDNTAKFLNLQSSKQGIDGSQVFDYWKDGRIDEIFKYCKRDVHLTRDIYKIVKV